MSNTINTPSASTDSQKSTPASHSEFYTYLNERGVSLNLLKGQGLPKDLLVPWDGNEQIKVRDQRVKDKLGPDPRVRNIPHRPLDGLLLRYQKCSDKISRCRVRWFGDDEERTYGGDNDSYDMGSSETSEAPRWDASAASAVPYLRCYRSKHEVHLVVEAPFKAISAAQYGYSTIGMATCDSGIHDPNSKTLSFNSEARRVNWGHGTYFILADSGQLRNPRVANGVGRASTLLHRAGHNVRICYLPERVPKKDEVITDKSYDQGVDDYLAGHYKAWKKRIFDRLSAKAVALEADGLAPLSADEIEALAEAAGRRRAKRMLQIVIRDAVPGNPLDRIRAASSDEEREALLRDPIFKACLSFSTPAERILLAKAYGPGSKGLLAAASQEFQTAVVEHAACNTPEYSIESDALCYQGAPVCNFSAEIKEEVCRDDGISTQRTYRITGKQGGNELPLIEASADEFGSMNWVSQWPSKACINAGKLAQEHARVAIQTLSTPSTKTVYTQTGWREIGGEHVYLLPGGGVGKDGYVDVECEVSAKYARPELPKDDEDARAALTASLYFLSLAPKRVTVPLLAMVYAAPLRPLLPDGLDFTLWLYGQTGSMKSCLAGVAQSHYGAFSYTNLPANWTDTITTMEKHSSINADTLWTVDNLVPAKTAFDQKSQTSKANSFLQAVGDGQGKGRQNRDLKDRARFVPRAGVLSTAEILPPADNESTFGRIFAVKLAKGDVQVPLLTWMQDQSSLLQKSLGAYLKWLAAEDWDALRKRIKERMVVARDIYRDQVDAHSRLPTTAAKLLETINVLCLFGEDIGLSTEWGDALYADCRAAILEALNDQPKVDTATPMDQWLAAFRALHSLGKIKLVPRDDSLTIYDPGSIPVGWLAGEEVYLDPMISYQEVTRYLGEQWRCSSTELYRQMLDASVVVDGQPAPVPLLAATEKAPKGGRRHTCKRTRAGKKDRVIVFNRIALGVAHGGLRAVVDADGDVSIDEAAE